MQVNGFEMVNEAGEVLVKCDSGADLVKSHVKGYTRKDGAYVADHDDKRQAKSGSYADHPSVVGMVGNHRAVGAGGKVVPGNGDPTGATTTSFDFAGKTYKPTGKTGQSMHDKTPVHEFEHEDSGHRVWADGKGRVHADSMDEVKPLRDAYEAGNKGASERSNEVGYQKPAHVKTKADEFDHLSKIAPEDRSPEMKARLKKLNVDAGMGKHSPEYKAHLEAEKSKDAPTFKRATRSKTGMAKRTGF